MPSDSQSFEISVAGAHVRVRPRFGEVRELCADYLVDGGAPDLEVCVTPEDLAAERERAGGDPSWPDSYLETLVVLRRIAEWAPAHDRLLMHGVALAYHSRAWLLSAPSGTGKSTHAALWRRCLGPSVCILNGDKPLVAVPAVGEPRIYGTPWAGKEGWNENASAPLAGLCLLERAEAPGESRAVRLDAADALAELMGQVYLPEDPLAAACTLELVDCLLARVPVWRLVVDMTEDAVRASFEALTGEDYGRARGRARI